MARAARIGHVRQGWRAAWVALAVLPALTHLVQLLTTDRPWRFEIYSDDAYYYLGVARSLVEGHGSTVTGLVETNGYHPLWLAMLVPLSALFRDPHHLLTGLAVLQGVLWALGVREAARIERLLGCPAVAATALVAYAVLAVVTGRLAFIGMESAVVLPLLLALIRTSLEAGTGTRDHVRLGVLLAALCLARLDAVLAAVPAGLVLAARGAGSWRAVARRAAVLAAPGALALSLYLALNQVVFGTPAPVSGQAKSLGAPFFNLEPLAQTLQAGKFFGDPLWFGACTLVLLGAAWVSGSWRADRRLRGLVALTAALVAGELVLLTYLVVRTSYPVWPWYQYLLPVLAFCAVVVLGRWVVEHRDDLLRRGVPLVVAGFLVVQAAVAFRPEDRAYPGSVYGARFVVDRLPPDAVLAMGDRAGIFAFLSERPLLHLEGLTADADYLDALVDGRAVDRMVDEGVDYYVRAGPPGRPVTVDGRDCERFAEPHQGDGPKVPVVVCEDDRLFLHDQGAGEDQFGIWIFRPERNGA